MDLKAILTALYLKYETKESTFDFFKRNQGRPELGILGIDEDSKKGFFHEEKSASTVFNKYLRYTNFGREGKPYDVIHRIMEVSNGKINFPEAVKLLLSWESEPIQLSTEKKSLVFEQKEKQKPYSENYLSRMISEAKRDMELFNSLLKGLFRSCSDEEILSGIQLFNIGLNKFESEEEGSTEIISRLFIPEYDENKIAHGSFRYNRSLDPKGLLRKNCKRVIFGSHLIHLFDKSKPVIFAEGHSDTSVNNAKRFQTLTTGSSTTKIGDNISLLAGMNIHFYPDCDIAGLKGVCLKIIEIENFNKTASENDLITYEVFWWAESFTSPKTGKTTLKKDVIKEQITIFKKLEFHAPENAKFKNWKILKKGDVKEGYDFIDFHTDTQESPKYSTFMSKYKY